MSDRKGKQFVVGAVVGGLIGTVTALLFAPKSGRELRSDISEQYSSVSEKTQQIASNISQKSQKIAKSVSSHATEWVGKAKGLASNAASEVKSWRESDHNESNGVNTQEAGEQETEAQNAEAQETEAQEDQEEQPLQLIGNSK